MKVAKLAVAAIALAAAGSAHAFGIGVRAGTTGLGADVAWEIAPTLSARLGYSKLDWNLDTSTDAVEYDGKLKLSAVNAFVDFRPLGPLFRLTGGFLFGDNQFDLSASRGGGSLNGTVEPGRSAAPYLGIGWGNVSGAGINFYTDFGIAFHGSPKVSLNANCGTLTAGQCANLRNEAAAERARLEDKLSKYKYYPVANIGLTIGF